MQQVRSVLDPPRTRPISQTSRFFDQHQRSELLGRVPLADADSTATIDRPAIEIVHMRMSTEVGRSPVRRAIFPAGNVLRRPHAPLRAPLLAGVCEGRLVLGVSATRRI